MINKRQKHKSKNSKSTKTQKTKNTKTRKSKNKKHRTKNTKTQTKQVQLPNQKGEERKQGNGKRNGLLWCLVPYVWELDLLKSNHV